MVFTKSFLFPSLRISTITAASSCFLYYILMASMITIFKTVDTYDTCLVHSAIIAFYYCILKCHNFCTYLFIYFFCLGNFYIFFQLLYLYLLYILPHFFNVLRQVFIIELFYLYYFLLLLAIV
jgi:hypothetical protein